MFKPLSTLPPVSRDPEDILKLFGPQAEHIQSLARRALGVNRPILGCDLEYRESERYVEEPTVLGVSDGFLTVSVPFDEGLAFFKELRVRHPNILFVGHAFTSADKFAFRQVGEVIELEDIEDTIIRFFLTNAHLCKSGAKVEDGDGEKKGKGYMNLWTFLSLYTDFYNYKECVTGSTKVQLADNSFVPIRELVNGKYSGKVKSLSMAGLTEAKVTGWHRLDRRSRNMYRLEYEEFRGRGGTNSGAIFTEDHEILTVDGWKRIDSLGRDLIATGTPGLSSYQKSALKGCLLGDAHVGRLTPQLHLFHATAQLEYLNYKKRLFSNLGEGNTYQWKKASGGEHWISPSLPIFRNLEKYSDGEFDVFSLAIWFMDDGHLSSDGMAEITCTRMSQSEINFHLKNILALGIEGHQTSRKGRIVFTVEETKKLVKLIGEYVPPCMRYKLGSYSTNSFDPSLYEPSFQTFYDRAIVKEVTVTDKTVFCIDVEGTENFITHGGVVHNCWGAGCRHEFCPKHDVWGYNGADSSGPIFAIPQIITQSKIRGVDKLYPLHRELAYVLGEMSRYGVQVDREYLFGNPSLGTLGLQGEFELNKRRIEESLPFNPKSNKAALSHFKEKGIELKDWTEDTIRKGVEEFDDEELAVCLDYKELGNGTDRWFAPVSKDKSGDWTGYMDQRGKIHPRLGMFTSTGRLQCTSPNLQNVAKRRVDRHLCECGEKKEAHPGIGHDFKGVSLGKLVRRAIIASPGHYLLKADYSNAENRVFLFLGGHHIPNEIDLHLRVSDIANLTPEMEFSISLGGPREAAKSIQHAGNYLEGLQLKQPAELKTARMKAEIDAGARLVFPEWTFNGKIVTFTGANLARRAFGDASWLNRAKALDVASKYFGGFPGARDLQKRITKQAETQKAIITPHGYYLLSFGDDEERCKTGAAMWGSNPVAHFTKLALVTLFRKFVAGRPLRPVLQVHDEIICEVPLSIDPREAASWLREDMEIETPEIPGLILPIGNPSKGELASYGPNWSQTKAVKI